MMKQMILAAMAAVSAPLAAQTLPAADIDPGMRDAMAAAAMPAMAADPRLAPSPADYAGADLPAGWRPASAASWQGQPAPAGGAIVPAAMTEATGGGVILAGWHGGRGGWEHGGWNRGYRGGWDRGYRGDWDDHRWGRGWGGGWGGYRPYGYYRPPVVVYGGGWRPYGYWRRPVVVYGGGWGGGYYGRPYGGYYGRYYGRCRADGSGALVGGIAGAGIGYGLGNRWDRTPGVIIGGVVGALAGSAIERSGC